MANNIYCDDAGFTGDNLLNVDQPYFAYSAIAIDPEDAAGLVADLRARFRIGDPEIKGMALYQRAYALDAISWLLNELGERASVAVSDKLYSLACKFFEYVFEPVLAPNSLFFYERGFHLHIANVIWAHLVRGDMSTKRIAGRFETLMRRRRGEPQRFFEPLGATGQPDPIDAIQRFAHACRPQIEKEMDGLADENGRVKWVLDLSFSSAKSVLCTMGERFGALNVMFDDSKPLMAYRDFFDGFVGRTEIPSMTLRGRTAPLIFNLAKPVAFGSSKTEPGLQLADLVASFSALASRDRETTRGREILSACLPWFNDESVWPDLDHLRLDRKENMLNAVMLLELVARAESGKDIIEGMPFFYEAASRHYDVNPPLGIAADR